MTVRRSRAPRVRVVHVASQLSTGGLEKLLIEFAKWRDARVFELNFVSLGAHGRVADEIKAAGCGVTALDYPPGLRPGLVCRLAEVFLQLRADVVHTHNTRPMLYAAPAARLARARAVIHTRHGQRFHASRKQNSWFRLTSYLVDRVVCVSEDSQRLSRQEGISPDRTVTILNGIDIGKFGYTGPTPGGPAVTVSRLSPEKDVANLLRAIPLVVAEFPHFRVEVAGDGECRHELNRLACELRIERHVRFLGDVRDVAAVLGRASLFILPSRTEGISLTLLEAMARGLPCVATRVGGNPEVISDGATGVLAPPQSPGAMAAAILEILRDPARGRDMGETGRRRVESRFDVRRMVSEYEALYRTVCMGEPGSRCFESDSQGNSSSAAADLSDSRYTDLGYLQGNGDVRCAIP